MQGDDTDPLANPPPKRADLSGYQDCQHAPATPICKCSRQGSNLGVVEDLSSRFADLLESTATKVRSFTVDPLRRVITIVGLAVPALVFGVFAIVFLFMTVHTALAIPLGQWGAYAVEAGLFGVIGLFMWMKRTAKDTT